MPDATKKAKRKTKPKTRRIELTSEGVFNLRAVLRVDQELPDDSNSRLSDLRSRALYRLRHSDDPGDCPACQQTMAIYPRTFDKRMARMLQLWYEKWPDLEWHALNDLAADPSLSESDKLLFRGGDFAKMRWWGLIEEQPKEGTANKKNSGIYRLTQDAIDFMSDPKVRFYKRVNLYANQFLCYKKGETTNFEEALGTPFSYQDTVGHP